MSWTRPTDFERELLENTREKSKELIKLAQLVSLAPRVEPLLLRNMRRLFHPEIEPEVESLLWFSPLINARSTRNFSLSQGIARILTDELKSNKSLFNNVWKQTQKYTQHWNELDILEQELRYYTLIHKPNKVKQGLRNVLKRINSSQTEDIQLSLARWIKKTLPAILNNDQDIKELHLLSQYSAIALGSTANWTNFKQVQELPTWLKKSLPEPFENSEVGIRLHYDSSKQLLVLEFTSSDKAELSLTIPSPLPAKLYIQTGQDSNDGFWEVVNIGSNVELLQVSDSILLRTIDGKAYSLKANLIEAESTKTNIEKKQNTIIHLAYVKEDQQQAKKIADWFRKHNILIKLFEEKPGKSALEPNKNSKKKLIRLWSPAAKKQWDSIADENQALKDTLLLRTQDTLAPLGESKSDQIVNWEDLKNNEQANELLNVIKKWSEDELILSIKSRSKPEYKNTILHRKDGNCPNVKNIDPSVRGCYEMKISFPLFLEPNKLLNQEIARYLSSLVLAPHNAHNYNCKSCQEIIDEYISNHLMRDPDMQIYHQTDCQVEYISSFIVTLKTIDKSSYDGNKEDNIFLQSFDISEKKSFFLKDLLHGKYQEKLEYFYKKFNIANDYFPETGYAHFKDKVISENFGIYEKSLIFGNNDKTKQKTFSVDYKDILDYISESSPLYELINADDVSKGTSVEETSSQSEIDSSHSEAPLNYPSRYYIERNIERKIIEHVQQGDQSLIIKSPRRMGKTTLLRRIQYLATQNNQKVCYIDLSSVSNNYEIFSNFITGSINTVINEDLEDSFGAHPFQQLDNSIKNMDIKSEPFLLLLDDADALFQYDYHEHFFKLVRSWAISTNIFSVVLAVESTEVLNPTLVNHYNLFVLDNFNSKQISKLNSEYNHLLSNKEITKLHKLTGGHPFLTQIAFEALKESPLENLERESFLSNTPIAQHMDYFAWRLRNNKKLISVLTQIIEEKECRDEMSLETLVDIGLVSRTKNNYLEISNQIYHSFLLKSGLLDIHKPNVKSDQDLLLKEDGKHTLWKQCLNLLEKELSKQEVNTWLRTLHGAQHDSILVLLAPNTFVYQHVNDHHLDKIKTTVKELPSGKNVQVILQIGGKVEKQYKQQLTLWKQCLNLLEKKISKQEVNTWLRTLHDTQHDSTLVLLAPNTFVYQHVNDHHLDRIKTTVKELPNGKDVQVILQISNEDKFKNNDRPLKSESVNLYCAYSHKDEALHDELSIHLSMLKRQGILKTWHDKIIDTGTELDQEISSSIGDSNIILLLVSSSFLASDYCYDIETQKALEMHQAKEAIVIPVILHPCEWHITPLGKLQALPSDGKAISKFANHHDAFLNISNGIKRAALSFSNSFLLEGNTLDKKLTFNNFPQGKSNQLAVASSKQVAENPGISYNPLFIYGGVGLGKSHLLHAIGNKILEDNNNAKVACLHSERFVNILITALRTNRIDEFKDYFSSVDALLIDDIQFFSGKNRSTEKFFEIYNILLEKNIQIVMTSDRYPRDIEGIDGHLRSRLNEGLTVEVEPPDLETRVAILATIAKKNHLELPRDAAFFIAKNFRSNARDLEGALQRVTASMRLYQRTDITLDFVHDALRDQLTSQYRMISIENIKKVVAQHYNIKISDLESKSRVRSIALPRQVAMALSYNLNRYTTLHDIGDHFGNRNHQAILYAVNKIKELRNTDNSLDESYRILERTLTR